MSTQVQQVPGGWVVSTVIKQGKRLKRPRVPVFVADPSLDAMRAEVELQADAARRTLLVTQATTEPVE